MVNNVYYANMPMHYAEIFKDCNNDKNFKMKNFDILLIFA